MPSLDALARMTRWDRKLRAIYWCKHADGRVVEHVMTAHEGHEGHIQCVPIAAADPGAML